MITLLQQSELADAVQLSAAAGWNQTELDWGMLLALAPDGCFGIHEDGKLIATASLLSYGRRLGWVGMVLTHLEYQRRGFARALLERVLQTADAAGIETLKLDATEQGQPLYQRLGFRTEQPVERWWRPGALPATEQNNGGGITDCALALDVKAFGANRSALLGALASRSHVSPSECGFAFLRPGLRSDHVGPCVARDAGDARGLVSTCIAGASEGGCLWDLLPRNSAATDLARDLGFVRQRELVRMVRGAPCSGCDAWIWAAAGFELG